MIQHILSLRAFRQPAFHTLALLSLVALLAACSPTAQPSTVPAATEAPTQAPQATEAPAAAEAPAQPPAATDAPAPTDAPTQAPAATEAPIATPAPTAPAFATAIKPILDQRCFNCHGGQDGVKGGLSMKTYDDLMKGGKGGASVVPGDPASSELVKLIDSGEMPKRASRLPQSEIDLITAWIAAGAENN